MVLVWQAFYGSVCFRSFKSSEEKRKIGRRMEVSQYSRLLMKLGLTQRVQRAGKMMGQGRANCLYDSGVLSLMKMRGETAGKQRSSCMLSILSLY